MRKKWKWYLHLSATAMMAAVSSAASAQTVEVDMKRAIELALTNNYSLKADSMNVVAAGYQVNVLQAEFKPHANYSSKSEYNLALPSQMIPGSFVGQPGKDFVPVQFGTRYNMNNGVELSQNLVRKSTRLQIANAKLNTGIAQTKLNLSREQLVYQVALSYYSLQAQAEMIRTTAADYNNVKNIVAIAKAQVENGTLKKIDYESLQINAANKQSYLQQLQTQYDDQLAYFNYLVGVDPAARTIISDSISVVNAVDPGNPILQREDIRLTEQLIESKEVEMKSIRAEKLPVMSAYLRFNYLGQFNEPGKTFNTDYWSKASSVGFTTSIPLFDGNRRKSRVNAAGAQLQQLQYQREHTRQLANKEWVSANETLNSNREQYLITKQNLAMAEDVFNSRAALYKEGVTTMIELLDAERELSQARNLHIQALINVQTAVVNVYKAKGTLLTEFLNTII